MEAIDSIKTRWSNYKYKNKDIPKDIIDWLRMLVFFCIILYNEYIKLFFRR